MACLQHSSFSNAARPLIRPRLRGATFSREGRRGISSAAKLGAPENGEVNFGRGETAGFGLASSDRLRRQRKSAPRLGDVNRENDMTPSGKNTIGEET